MELHTLHGDNRLNTKLFATEEAYSTGEDNIVDQFLDNAVDQFSVQIVYVYTVVISAYSLHTLSGDLSLNG